MFSLALIAAFALALVGASPSPQVGPIHPICLSPIFTGTPPNITAITPGTAVHGLLVYNNNGTAALDKTGLGGRFVFTNGTIGAYDGECEPIYLQISESSYSAKPLTWSYEFKPNQWIADFQTIIQAKKSGSKKFIACKPPIADPNLVWTLYLQTGSDNPGGLGPFAIECVSTELYISKNGLHEVGTTN